MAKKKTARSKKKKELKKKKSKTKSKKALRKEERAFLPSRPASRQGRQAGSLESREIWKKNGVLALILLLVITLNIWLYFREKGVDDQKAVVAEKQEDPGVTEPENVNSNTATKDELDGLDEEEKKVIQALLEDKELESWKTYKNTAYAFMLKYPGDWPDPIAVKADNGQKYKFKVSFRNSFEEGNDLKGFDVYVYRAQKSKNFIRPDYTDNLTKKDTIAEDHSDCGEIGTVYVSENQYPAMEIYYLKNNPCFNEAYFLVLEKGSYLYDIVPVPQGGINYDSYNGKKKVAETMPEFNKVVSSFNFVQMAAKKTTVVRRITAPKPLADTKIVGGKRVCAKKNDKPRKSKTHKKKHMDMECCLDPDEYPNPWCAY